MQSSLAGAVTPQKLKHSTASTHTPDQTLKFRLEDASPETEKVISYLRDLKQTTSARRTSKPQSLPFSVPEKITSTNKLTRVPASNTKAPLGLFNITVCTCTCSNSSPSKKLIIHTKCTSSSSPSKKSNPSLSSQKENIHPNNNRIHKVPSTKPLTNRRQPPPPVIKKELKEDKMRKEGPNPFWDLQLQQVKVVKCDQVKIYPTHLPYALVYIFS